MTAKETNLNSLKTKKLKQKKTSGGEEARDNPLASFIMDNKIFEDAVAELNNELSDMDYGSRKIDKHAFDIPISPAAIVGSLVGGSIAANQARKRMEREQVESDNTSTLSGNYYSQVKNIVQNLKIIFTPFGVIFVVKNGAKEVTIETIGTDEMSQGMFAEWQRKNAEYYKNLLLNKMYSEIQFVEQQFAKNILQRQLGIQGHIQKKASFDIPDVEDMSFNEIWEGVAHMQELYSHKSELTEKLAMTLISGIDDDEIILKWELPRPIDKYASVLSNPLSFLGINLHKDNDIRSLQENYLSPRYLVNRVKVGFLPDRIIFTVDNKMVSTLLAMDMNEQAFEKFQEENEKFFVRYFENEAKRGVYRMKGKLPQDTPLDKEASENIFKRSDISALTYFKLLIKHYDEAWFDWNVHVLVKTIEIDFEVHDGINDIALNKILCIQCLNNNSFPYTSYHVFEKILRGLTNKPIDFLSREADDLSLSDIALGLELMDLVTPDLDTYDEIEGEVFSYLVNLLNSKNTLIFMPSELASSESKGQFYSLLNERLLNAANSADIMVFNDEKKESDAIHRNEMIWRMSLMALSTSLASNESYDNQINGLDKILNQFNLTGNIKSVVSVQVIQNLIASSQIKEHYELIKAQEILL